MLELGMSYTGYLDVAGDDPRVAAFYENKAINHFG